MTWIPAQLPSHCPTSLTACTLLGYFYLDILSVMYSSDIYKGKPDVVEKDYDFVIVGAGAAGSVVAGRLSENENWKILLLEAGPEQPEITLIPGITGTLYGSNLDWQYVAQPDGKTCLARVNQTCSWPRGKGLGGSTIINSMLYIRGNAADYDEWHDEGNEDWDYKRVLPYFKKSENNLNLHQLKTEYHNADGPWPVSYYPYQDLVTNLTIDAFVELGVRVTDFNGAHQLGVGNAQTSTKNGERASSYTSFVLPHREVRKNLHVIPFAEVTKVLFDTKSEKPKATGVEYNVNGTAHVSHASKKVILSAGSINTPKLLMLSGIGHKELLEELHIPVVQDLPVGDNLQEHVTFNALTIRLSKETSTNTTGGEVLKQVFDYKLNKPNKLSYDGTITVMAYYNTTSDDPNAVPDVKFEFGPVNVEEFINDPVTYDTVKILPTAFYDGLLMRPMTIKPKSRGSIRLNTEDPNGPPLIYPNYYGDECDMDTLLNGVKFLLTLEDTRVFKDNGWRFIRTGFKPCDKYEWGTEDHIKCLALQYTSTTYHPVGTCKMGSKGNGVVDSKLKVHGVDGLMIIDASIMPTIPRGNTAAASIMIGEKGADYVKDEYLEDCKS